MTFTGIENIQYADMEYDNKANAMSKKTDSQFICMKCNRRRHPIPNTFTVHYITTLPGHMDSLQVVQNKFQLTLGTSSF